MTNAATPSPSAPSDEEVGQAILDAARYGDVEDLQELTNTYGKNQLGFRGGYGGNTALHFGKSTCVIMRCSFGVVPREQKFTIYTQSQVNVSVRFVGLCPLLSECRSHSPNPNLLYPTNTASLRQRSRRLRCLVNRPRGRRMRSE
jgi:hypothetical protein